MAEHDVDEQIVKWVFGKRDEGMSEDQILRSLEESGWNTKEVAMIMGLPAPKITVKRHNMLKIMYASVVIFAVLVSVVALAGFGVIFDDKIVYTSEECAKQELPDTACSTLDAMLGEEVQSSWLSPLASQTEDNDTIGLTPNLELDLNTWIKSEVLSQAD